MIYRVHHRSTYSYQGVVDLSYHALHLTPRALPHQKVFEQRISVTPLPASTSELADYFGNRITFLTLLAPHNQLVVDMAASVEVRFPDPPPAAATPPWENVRDALRQAGDDAFMDAAEYVHESPLVPVDAGIRDYAGASFTSGRPLLQAVLDLTARIKRDFTFDPAATVVTTPLAEVMANRRGVCQDFAHLQIAALRSFGLAARYVSGYIRSYRVSGPDLAGADASHAWVSVFSPGAGWIDVDPTNDLVAKEEHIVLAWGRDYGDVTPIRGVILGGGEHTLDVAVKVEATS
jgi:transglutaminase-like putative cysteine protease